MQKTSFECLKVLRKRSDAVCPVFLEEHAFLMSQTRKKERESLSPSYYQSFLIISGANSFPDCLTLSWQVQGLKPGTLGPVASFCDNLTLLLV